jgi:two-component sensor histidine kinase
MHKSPVRADDSPPMHIHVTPLKIAMIIGVNFLIALFIVLISRGTTTYLISLMYSQCIGISIATCTIAAANLIKTSKFALHVAFIGLALIAGAVIGVAIATMVMGVLFPGLPQIHNHENYQTSLLFALLFGLIVTYVFFSLQRISTERVKRLEVEKSAVVTEIKLLQSQMEPHFLFNTLSTILSLIDDEPQKAKLMLESFTSFLRSSLVTARNETITLAQEMNVVKNYLEIFMIRMGARLRYAIDIPVELRACRVPPLLIQPLVENAVKHGLEPSVRGGELLIQARREGDHVLITVADSGMGVNEMSPGNGIGLENIRKRLELAYNKQGRLVVEENKPEGIRVTVDIPFETGAPALRDEK